MTGGGFSRLTRFSPAHRRTQATVERGTPTRALISHAVARCCRQAKMAVLLLVDVTADPEHSDIEQADGAREHSRPVELVALSHLRHDAFSHLRQSAREVLHVLELQMILLLPPALVIQVLATAGCVHAGRL